GPAYAARQLGYDAEALAALPTAAPASFAGVANPLAIHPLAAGETVVDLGSGAGMDLLLAAAQVGPTGRAIGVDMTDAMLESARESAASMGFDHVEFRRGDLQELPIADESVDVVISNGVLNLVPDKIAAFSEAFRVLRPGGRLQLGDIVIGAELDEATRRDVDLWTGCIAGALRSEELNELLETIGFEAVREVARFNAFDGTTKEATSRELGVVGVCVSARRPRH
ncbi:MAG: methyltransferase domain-containing protein, partial [Acidobacteriota bacterium]